MSLIEIESEPTRQRQPSPGGFSSNNPFRNRTISPASSNPQSPMTNGFAFSGPSQPAPVMVEPTLSRTNPFADSAAEKKELASVQVRSVTPVSAGVRSGPSSPPKPSNSTPADLFNTMSIADRSPKGNPPPYSTVGVRGADNGALRPGRYGGNHQPSRSQEEQWKNTGVSKFPTGSKSKENGNVFADPPAPPAGVSRFHARHNSDSSVSGGGPIHADEERRRKERYRRERDARLEKGKEGKSHRSRKPNPRMDIIDSLDVTSIYGKGMFHHDGPFDACNPDRNRKGARRAPMEAFAKDSKNNAIGGSGPLNKNIDFDQFHGRTIEGFRDYATSGVKASTSTTNANTNTNPSIPNTNGASSESAFTAASRAPPESVRTADRASNFNPIERGPYVHGEESMGLGTTTFLEGAPAARRVIERRASDGEDGSSAAAATAGASSAATTTMNTGGGLSRGLSRKRSLAQRIRGINNGNKERGFRPSGRVTSPEGASGPTAGGAAAAVPQDVISTGGSSAAAPLSGGGGLSRARPAVISPSTATNTSTTAQQQQQQQPRSYFDHQDYDDAYEKKGQRIQIAEASRSRRGSFGAGEDTITVSSSNARSSPCKPTAAGPSAGGPVLQGAGKVNGTNLAPPTLRGRDRATSYPKQRSLAAGPSATLERRVTADSTGAGVNTVSAVKPGFGRPVNGAAGAAYPSAGTSLDVNGNHLGAGTGNGGASGTASGSGGGGGGGFLSRVKSLKGSRKQRAAA